MALRLIHVGFGGWGLDWTKVVLDTPEVETVGVADPNPAVHAPLALSALAAGKHVLVEKPFAPTLAEAQAVVAAAAAQGRVLMVSQN